MPLINEQTHCDAPPGCGGGCYSPCLAAMLHLMKLAVGVRDPAHLHALQALRVVQDPPLLHRTRQMPRRSAEIVAGGSLYWVIAGSMLVRQRIVDIVADARPDGSACAALILDPALVGVVGRPVRPFQGWRYLAAEAAPPDLTSASEDGAMPPALAQILRELCLL
jgi:hypothetical protein